MKMIHSTPVMLPSFARLDGTTMGASIMNLPVAESALLELRLAELVVEARLRAQARLSNFFVQQQQQQQLLQLRQQKAAVVPPAEELCPRTLLLRQCSDKSVTSEGTGTTHLSDRSETSLSTSASLRVSPVENTRVYVETIRDTDVLCGRGGRSNHHPGNKRYRFVISEMRQAYKTTVGKSNKTDLSRAIVDHVCSYGGRFLKREESTGRYYVLTRGESRKKTSQALRETKVLKWTK